MRFAILLALAAGVSLPTLAAPAPGSSLLRLDREGRPSVECPLKHTDVKAEVSGFFARVTVTQEFQNTAPDTIEAIYVFPLPHMAAVDTMDLYIGERHMRGDIKRREEARAIYEAARDSGKVSALLDQQRPNIFSQHVSNIRPGEKVRVLIHYVERLKYEQGEYEWVFPMVTGPRYAPDIPDIAEISPPVLKPGTRSGHDITLTVSIRANLPIQAVSSTTHAITVERSSPEQANTRLRDATVIPNKDLVLRYDIAGPKLRDAILAHRAAKGGFFSLLLQPPDRIRMEKVAPKELVFVLDTSGFMSGFPIEKAKETMRMAIAGLNARDTFNLITFAGDTHVLFSQPVPATPDNVRAARRFSNAAPAVEEQR